MNKLIACFIIAVSSLCAWDDHPDNDNSRLDNAFDSQNAVESTYDWSNRDPDSKDNDYSSSESRPGTILDSPDRDK